jgi:hypothetical protein
MTWPIFITVFSSLCVGLHAYALWKTAQAIPFGKGLYAVSIAFIIIMASVQFTIRYLVRSGHDDLARGFALVGFTWMGFLFLFVCASLVEDGYRILIKTAGLFSDKMNPKWILPRPAAIFTILVVSGGITVYGLIDAIRIRMEHVVVETEKIPLELERFRIVQISDVHLGLIVRKDRLGRIVEKIRAAKPDLLVSTGDLVDGSMGNREDLAAMLRELPVKHGKFAITGNHEYYAGIRRSLEFIQTAGFTFLPGKSSSFLPWLSIAGVDDPAGGEYANTDEPAVLSAIPEGRFALLLKHRPYVDEKSLGLFDLQLSGHTHKGQIFPFTLVVKLLFPVDAGRVNMENGSTLYVSRGTGTWGPPIRFLSPPEVTVIDLVPSKQNRRMSNIE